MERNQAEEIARSADRITEAVRELTFALDRLLEYQEARRDEDSGYRERGALVLGFLGVGGMPSGRAESLALGLKRSDEVVPRVLTAEEDPTPEQVRERREARCAAEEGRP